ncbi:MAG: acetamidase/formamidase family protein [Fervidicoccaceae archaeon]
MTVESFIVNEEFTNGIIGPHVRMLGTLADGGKVRFVTAPGCWGPMITPTLRGGHEVNVPVLIEGANVGDSIAIKIEKISVRSKVSTTGVDSSVANAFIGDPYVFKKCPVCNEPWPNFEIVGIGVEAIRCKKCGSPVSPFRMLHGYTAVFDEKMKYALTVRKEMAERIAQDAEKEIALPKNSKQIPAPLLAKADIVGTPSRLRPFLGQIGTSPAVDIPDSHNAGDFGYFLIDAPHPYRITREQYDKALTDGHLDVDATREGAIIIAPSKIKGAGVYIGDAHALQGDGEVAGHTLDVSSEVVLRVEVIKGLEIEGPIILPQEQDLPPLAKPWRKDEWEEVLSYARSSGIEIEQVAPIQVIGSGPTLNDAAKKGFERASKLLGMRYEEVLNRVTYSGAVEIGRLPGIVQVSLQVPIEKLEKINLADIVIKHYNLPF